MDGLVKNTLMFRFPDGAPGPSVVEIARFVKSFDADKFTMESSYKISEERCICIKFMNERAMKDALMQNPENHVFQYSSGETVEVKMSVAGGCSKYIRIFDLPPEVPDQEIGNVLGKYGVVRRMVREKFPAQLELDLTTGVRGVYIEIKKEIPATLFFLNRRGRIYYEGVKHKCFLCKQEGHLKADCPRNTSNNKRNTEVVENAEVGRPDSTGSSSVSSPPQPPSFAAMLKSKPPVVGTEGSKMTLLVPAAKMVAEPVCNSEEGESSHVVKAPATQNADKTIGATVDTDDSDGLPNMEVDCSATKRQHEGSSTEDEGNTRASRSRKQKKDSDPLKIIESEPIQSKGKDRRARSKN